MKGTGAVTIVSRGLFSPDSMLWLVNREALTALAGSRALMMELAHPLIAAGVASHSNFRRGAVGRIYRTTRAMTDITFGSEEAARRAARHIEHCHRRVSGTLQEKTGPLNSGTPYYADDPHLKVWVLATLIDSILLVYDLFVRPLSHAEKESYFRDSLRIAALLGIPPGMMPDSYDGFTAYVDSMVASDLLTVGDTARQVATAMFAPPLIGSLARVASFAGIGLLPDRIREGYRFRWDEKRERWLHQIATISRRIRPLIPSVLCVNPRALLAERRFYS